MTLSEEECAQKWILLTETLVKIDGLIKDISQKHQNAADLENIEIVKLHQAAAYAMTELEKCKTGFRSFFEVLKHFYAYIVKLRFTLANDELKDHPIQIEEVSK